MTPGHQAQKVFLDDVNTTYGRIRTRAREIAADRASDANAGAGVEQIQLHAVEPGTKINIVIPPKDSTDENEQKARAIFETFPPGLQRALEHGSLDEVNKVLGKMSVEEAEEIVGQLGEVSCRAADSIDIVLTVVLGRHVELGGANNRCHNRGGSGGFERIRRTGEGASSRPD